MSLVDDLANAIAQYESGGKPDALSVRNNNPGNLRSWGNYPTQNGYVVFPDWDTGMNALKAQVSKNIARGLNLYEFFGGKAGVYGGYAPAGDNNRPRTYAQTVAGWLGLDPAVPLQSAGASAPFVSPFVGPASTGGEWSDMPGASLQMPDWLPVAAVGVGAVGLFALLS